MKPFPSNPAFEFAGIMISDPNLKELTDVKLITAWVFIPDSEPLRDHNFQGHIAASKNNIAGTPVVFIGEDTKIEPGKWTRLVLGTFQDTSFIPNFKWNGDINILNINVFCDKDYDGSIYFDDITFYK